jgi:hypothetical protein
VPTVTASTDVVFLLGDTAVEFVLLFVPHGFWSLGENLRFGWPDRVTVLSWTSLHPWKRHLGGTTMVSNGVHGLSVELGFVVVPTFFFLFFLH